MAKMTRWANLTKRLAGLDWVGMGGTDGKAAGAGKDVALTTAGGKSPVSPTDWLSTIEVLARLRISRPTLHAWIANADFPRPFRCSARRFVWKVSEVEQWLQSRPRA